MDEICYFQADAKYTLVITPYSLFRRGGDFGELSRAVNPLRSLGIEDSTVFYERELCTVGCGRGLTPPLRSNP
jgi:hypothetical protein